MTFQISSIISDLQSRLLGYSTLLGYRYMNLCVKAEPGALLSAVVDIDSIEYPLEKVAAISLEKFSYHMLPIDKSLVPYICKALLEEHPEFSQEMDGDTIVFTVPPVDKDRKDALEDMVDALYKDCELRMKADFGVSSTKAGIAAVALPEETQKETEEELQKTYDGFVERCAKLKEAKLKEIEEGYARYCEEHQKEQEEKEQKAQEEGLDNIFKMTLDPMEN